MPKAVDQRSTATRTRILESIVATRGLHLSRTEFARLAQVSPRTLDAHLVALRDLGLVTPRAPLSLGGEIGLVLAVAIRSQTCVAALVDPHGDVVRTAELREQAGLRSLAPRELLSIVGLVVSKLLRGSDGEAAPVELVGIAISVPSPLRKTTRPVGQSMHEQWRDAEQTGTLRESFAEALDAPLERVHVINDAHVHALATAHDQSRKEAADAARLELRNPLHDRSTYRERMSITLHLGGVVGAGVVLLGREQPGSRLGFVDTRLLSGGHSMGGEIAHLPLSQHWFPVIDRRSSYTDLGRTDPERRCFCGASGHLQAHANDEAVAARVRHLDRSALNRMLALETIDDPGVRDALRDVGFLLGLVMMSPLKLLDPKTVHLTGALARPETVLGFRSGLEERRWTGSEVDLRTPPPGKDTLHMGVRGAALIIFREWIYRKFGRIVETGTTHGTTRNNLPLTFTYRYPAR